MENRQPKVALDIEGVLADTHSKTFERSDLLDGDDLTSWSFETEERREEFMHVSQNLWHNHNHLIPPTVETLREDTQRLYDHYDVDIVTSRSNVDTQLKEWLSGYGVVYDDFHVECDKALLGDYIVHIDDSPNVVRDATIEGRSAVLIDRPYNQDVDTSGNKIVRVNDVSEAVEVLVDDTNDVVP